MELNLETNKTVLEYYTKLTQEYDNGNVRPPEIILPPVPDIPDDCTSLPSPPQYIFPSVILWDPLQQLYCFKDGIKCPFEAHGEEEYLLVPKKSRKGNFWWHAGLRSSLTPRQLCSSSWPAVLLSRIYFCTGKMRHRTYIAHDPEILSKIPTSESHKIPFVLLHRTGFTKELSETVTSLVASGMNLQDIEQVIYQQHITNFMQCKVKYVEDSKLCLQNANLQVDEESFSFPDYKPVGVPSMEMILASLLDSFQEKKIYYNQKMSELSAKILLMGHFYKASQQMGTTGSEGKEWVPKYDFVYAIMNEHGQVIAWQVTKGTNTENVSTLVKNVSKRLTHQGVKTDLILVPDCCQQKDWLRSIFGPSVMIKMDPCFAVQKLEKRFKIRKGDHEHMQACVQDFCLVFRKATDLGTERNEATPSSEVITGNMDLFISKWKNFRGETNERLLHDPALRELESLKCCISKGCLSGIPPRLGAEFVNELRGYIYPVLHRCYLNADLAIPVLMTLFYFWNERHCEAFDGEFTPASLCKSNLDTPSYTPIKENFGCVENELGIVQTEEVENCESSLTQRLRSIQSIVFQILFAVDYNFTSDLAPLTESNVPRMDWTILNKVITQAENYNFVLQSLKSLCLDDFPLNLWHHHLSSCCLFLFSRCGCQVEDKATLDYKMRKNVILFSGTLLKDDSDSDGFFVALSSSIFEMIKSLEENPTELTQLKEHLNSVGYSVDEFKDDINDTHVTVLRQIICAEWQKNKAKYAKLLTSPFLDFEEQAELFIHKGYSQAEMINILPIAVVQALNIPLIIFTSMDKFPVVPLIPAVKLVTSRCLYMAYSTAGFGSYYPVTVTPTKKSSDKPKCVCRCGLGNSKNKQERSFCLHIPGRYLTRCECFRNGVACNYMCRCFNCANPNGTSKDSRALHTCQKTRLRSRHKLQKMRRHSSSLDDDMQSSWSEQDCLVFQFLIDAMKFSGSYPSNKRIMPDEIQGELQNLQRCSSNTPLLKDKTLDDLKIHLNYFSRNLESFQTHYKKQGEESWGEMGVCSVTVEMSDGNQLVVIMESSE